MISSKQGHHIIDVLIPKEFTSENSIMQIAYGALNLYSHFVQLF